MALPVPSTPIPTPGFVGYVKRGNQFVDVISKSTYTPFEPYITQNQCDVDDYKVFGGSFTLNDTVNCQSVTEATGSLSLRLPHNAVESDFDIAMTWLIAVAKADAGF